MVLGWSDIPTGACSWQKKIGLCLEGWLTSLAVHTTSACLQVDCSCCGLSTTSTWRIVSVLLLHTSGSPALHQRVQSCISACHGRCLQIIIAASMSRSNKPMHTGLLLISTC